MYQSVLEGLFYPKDGVFRAPSGQEKFYVASDHLESTLYRAFTPNDLFDITIREGLHFDQAKQTGILLHMLPTVGENGRFGVVAPMQVGMRSAARAQSLCRGPFSGTLPRQSRKPDVRSRDIAKA